MTEEQRQHALALCGQILETAAKVEADLREAKAVIEEMTKQTHPLSWPGSSRPSRLGTT